MPEQGGETAFPKAKTMKGLSCEIVVKPTRGDALLFYRFGCATSIGQVPINLLVPDVWQRLKGKGSTVRTSGTVLLPRYFSTTLRETYTADELSSHAAW